MSQVIMEWLVAICRNLIKNDLNLLFASSKELDLTNQIDVEDFFKTKPKIVINAAKAEERQIKLSYQFLMDNLKIQNNLIDNSYKFNVEKLFFR